MKHTIATSGDGSNTLQLTEFNESYHSRNGAYTEANHIYIKCGLEYLFMKTAKRIIPRKSKPFGLESGGDYHTKPWSRHCDLNDSKDDIYYGNDVIIIYDIGFGTALNCILAWCWQQQRIREGLPYPKIEYYGIEKFPITVAEAMEMNYPDIIATHNKSINFPDVKKIASAFQNIHECEWFKNIEISPEFTLHKTHADITSLGEEYFSGGLKEPSAIFYDPFSPATQPELWSEEIFRTIAASCKKGSVLTTYCSKGTVKEALRSAGFTLQRLAGPPGKRHILRGIL